MPVTINASPSNGLVQTADGSGIIKVQSNGVTTNALAWVNFNGVTTAVIRSSYNVSSVTRSGTGNYLITFTNALSDANYSALTQATNGTGIGVDDQRCFTSTPSGSYSTTTFRVAVVNSASTAFQDASVVNVAIFGN